MKSKKPVKELSNFVLPYKVTFPVRVEGSVNKIKFSYKANEESEIDSFSIYQAISHSSYGRYFKD